MHKWKMEIHESADGPEEEPQTENFSSVRAYLLGRLRARKILFGGDPRTETLGRQVGPRGVPVATRKILFGTSVLTETAASAQNSLRRESSY